MHGRIRRYLGQWILHERPGCLPTMQGRRGLRSSCVHGLHRRQRRLQHPALPQRNLRPAERLGLRVSRWPCMHQRKPMPGIGLRHLPRWQQGLHGRRMHERLVPLRTRELPPVQNRRRLWQSRVQRLLRWQRHLRYRDVPDGAMLHHFPAVSRAANGKAAALVFDVWRSGLSRGHGRCRGSRVVPTGRHDMHQARGHVR